jgi:hypothetical protein
VDFHRIGLASAAVIVAGTYLPGYREHVKIMEAVWPLTALYAGPLAHAANVLGGVRCRTGGCGPRPRHARPAFWAGTARRLDGADAAGLAAGVPGGEERSGSGEQVQQGDRGGERGQPGA